MEIIVDVLIAMVFVFPLVHGFYRVSRHCRR